MRHRLNSETCTETRLREGNWAGDSLVLFSSLSREWKDALTDKFGKPQEEIKKSWFAEHFEKDRNAFDFYVGHRYGDKNEKKLDLDLVKKYTFNASVLNTVVLMRNNRKAYAKALGGVSIDIWDSLSKDVNAFREVEHDLPATRDGLRYKVNKYTKALKLNQHEAYKTVVSGRLQNKNAKKVTEKEQMALLDELISKHTNLDNEIICTFYNIVAEKMNWKTITAMTVSNRKQKKQLVTHAGRNGVKSLKNTKLMQVKRSKPSAPMLYWTMDGWTAELLYQTTAVNSKGQNVTTYHNRLTVVVVLDAHNNYPIGYAIGTHETPELITAALKNAMQHARSLFGEFYMPFELQSDNYSVKKLRPIYRAVTPNFSPASVGNAKAKVIEPYFNRINKKYCKLMNNWSGHNVDSGSKNQPNTEYMDKIKKNYPDRNGCASQIESIISTERSKTLAEYKTNWLNTKEEHKQVMSHESYLLTFGTTTGYTNSLKGEGLIMTIDGVKHFYDCFDINFRHNAHLEWAIQYDENDLSQVLAISTDGSERFMLESKFIQPMALADQTDADIMEWERIKDFNKTAVNMIIHERADNAKILDQFLEHPELNDTMAKHLLSDSLGQHKNHKSAERLQAAKAAVKIEARQTVKTEKAKAKTFADEQLEYYNEKVNINDFIDA
ncbi:MAG: hypothetical protein ACOH2D_11775 [Gelidibacter sp.]